jgi:hypothetical protein
VRVEMPDMPRVHPDNAVRPEGWLADRKELFASADGEVQHLFAFDATVDKSRGRCARCGDMVGADMDSMYRHADFHLMAEGLK